MGNQPQSDRSNRSPRWLRRSVFPGLLLLAAFTAGCGHHRHSAHAAPQQTAPPPPDQSAQPGQSSQLNRPQQLPRIPITPVPPGGVVDLNLGHDMGNGQVFSDQALTAAHRTLPMGSLVTVTNLKTGQTSAMRITDRGPFVDGRIVDLTIASAKATGIYRAGAAEVRLDVYQTPKPIASGGRWCVQIGAFKSERKAEKLKSELLRQYPTSNVIEFPGQDSYWVRIRPVGDNRQQAEWIARHLRPSEAEAEAFLTRLD